MWCHGLGHAFPLCCQIRSECWWRLWAPGSSFQQKQEVRIGVFLLLPGCRSPPSWSYMVPNSNHVCLRPLDPDALPAWLLWRSLKSFLTTFDLRKHLVPPSCHCYLNPQFLSMSLGKSGKAIPRPIRSPQTHPSLSALSFKVRQTIEVIGGSTVAGHLESKFISWYSSCHRLMK